jgi:hypothetical protein
MDETTTSLRDTIAEVVESTAPEPSPAPASDNLELPLEGGSPEPTESPTANASRARDEQGRFAPKTAKAAAEEPQAEPVEQAQEPEGIQPGPKAGPKTDYSERPPASWRPNVREHWAALPAEVRAEVARREQEVQRTLQETAEARKYVEAINRVVAPYEMFIRAENSNPLQAIDNMMATAARLRTGTGPETAGLIAQLVSQFGVGRFGAQFIEQLDSALAGQQPRQDPTQVAVQQVVQQQLAPVQQFMSQFQQAQQVQRQRAQEAAQGEVASFLEQAEFGEDVREEMADIIELAQKRGRQVSLQEAYQQACLVHPDVRATLQARAKARGAQATTGAAQRARAAAVSVTGAPAVNAPAAQASDVRSAIEAAIAANSR